MKWRLQEGRGEAVYQIGVEDNGLLVGLSEEEMRASLKTLRRMAEKCVLPFLCRAHKHEQPPVERPPPCSSLSSILQSPCMTDIPSALRLWKREESYRALVWKLEAPSLPSPAFVPLALSAVIVEVQELSSTNVSHSFLLSLWQGWG